MRGEINQAEYFSMDCRFCEYLKTLMKLCRSIQGELENKANCAYISRQLRVQGFVIK
jgi:hypothetical protein